MFREFPKPESRFSNPSFNFAVEDVQFLRYSCTKWNNFKSFQKLKDLVSTQHVMNDLGERGIKILEDYKNILTENSEQPQRIIHWRKIDVILRRPPQLALLHENRTSNNIQMILTLRIYLLRVTFTICSLTQGIRFNWDTSSPTPVDKIYYLG